MAKVFSGIQPTGFLTIGNYLGAIKNWLTLQDAHECIYCIVDLHAITVPQDPKELRDACFRNLAMYVASGLDPEKSIIFTQSSVSNHAELGWIFSCVTPLGWLNRMTQFKDKSGGDKEKACLGLYAYPVLMAADILMYGATVVPVGDDQTQHVELARDIAGAFNRQFNTEYFTLPEATFNAIGTRVMSLRDGTKKMSKSDESDYSRINMTDDKDTIVQKIKKAKTDAISGIYYNVEERPDVSNLITIYAAFAGVSIEEAVSRFSGIQTSAFKEAVAESVISALAPIQQRYHELIKDPAALRKVAEIGAEKANDIASKRMKEIKQLVGLYS